MLSRTTRSIAARRLPLRLESMEARLAPAVFPRPAEPARVKRREQRPVAFRVQVVEGA